MEATKRIEREIGPGLTAMQEENKDLKEKFKEICGSFETAGARLGEAEGRLNNMSEDQGRINNQVVKTHEKVLQEIENTYFMSILSNNCPIGRYHKR